MPLPVARSDRHAWWREEAACLDMDAEVFFAPDDAGRDIALAACRGCPVRRPCLEHALRTREMHGIWGGTDEAQRQRMLRSGSHAA